MPETAPIAPVVPAARALRAGAGWCASEYLCTAGPRDPVHEERHGAFTVALVLEGSFRYRSPAGTALLVPGALMLGNHGTCYECGHDHGRGDRCVAFHFDPATFESVAGERTLASRWRFRTGALPALPSLAAPLGRARAMLADTGTLDPDESAIGLLEAVIGACDAAPVAAPRVSARDARRIGEAADHLARQVDEPFDLGSLAARVAMSKYHFLRVFKAITGMTPHQYRLEAKMRQAADRLIGTDDPVGSIAFDAGFGDLSTFHARFRRQFGRSPGEYRRGARGPLAR